MRLKWDFHELYDFGERITNAKHFEDACVRLTKEISKAYHKMLINNTPVETGVLRSAWNKGDNLAYRVTKVKDGYEVEFSNDTEYAHWVNYGHRVKNRKDSPYYKVKRRTVPYYDGNSSDYFVYGHFFVEKTVEKMTNGSHLLDDICYRELEKWFGWCVNGK